MPYHKPTNRQSKITSVWSSNKILLFSHISRFVQQKNEDLKLLDPQHGDWLEPNGQIWLRAGKSTVPSIRGHWERGRTARRHPSEGRTETMPPFPGWTETDGLHGRGRQFAVSQSSWQSPAVTGRYQSIWNSAVVRRVELYQASNLAAMCTANSIYYYWFNHL